MKIYFLAYIKLKDNLHMINIWIILEEILWETHMFILVKKKYVLFMLHLKMHKSYDFQV